MSQCVAQPSCGVLAYWWTSTLRVSGEVSYYVAVSVFCQIISVFMDCVSQGESCRVAIYPLLLIGHYQILKKNQLRGEAESILTGSQVDLGWCAMQGTKGWLCLIFYG